MDLDTHTSVVAGDNQDHRAGAVTDGIGDELADQESDDIHFLRRHPPAGIYDVASRQTGCRRI